MGLNGRVMVEHIEIFCNFTDVNKVTKMKIFISENKFYGFKTWCFLFHTSYTNACENVHFIYVPRFPQKFCSPTPTFSFSFSRILFVVPITLVPAVGMGHTYGKSTNEQSLRRKGGGYVFHSEQDLV